MIYKSKEIKIRPKKKVILPIISNIKSAEKEIDLLSKDIYKLEQENHSFFKNKQFCEKQVRYYKAITHSSSVETLQDLYKLNNDLLKYIDDKSNFFTKILEKFCKSKNKFSKYSIFSKAHYIKTARESQKKVSELIRISRNNWSINQMNRCKKELMNYMIITRSGLEPNDSVYWHDSYNQILEIFKILDEAGLPQNDKENYLKI